MTSKLDPELVIAEMKGTKDNCGSNYGRHGGEPPFPAEVFDAQAWRAPKIRTTGGNVACVQWTGRRKCKERTDEGGYGKMHGD